MRKKIIIGVTGVIALVALVSAYFVFRPKPTPPLQYKQEAIPTFFFHGFGGSYRSERQMTDAARAAGVTKTVVRADVSPDGVVTLSEKIPKDAKNLIVQVNYEENKNGNYPLVARWARNVFLKVKEQYDFKQFNVVGHSMGNMSIMFYLLEHSDEVDAKLVKQVNIAGHFDGILGREDAPHRIKLDAAGYPTPANETYKNLTALRKNNTFKTIDVLNIYGDLDDGTDSDDAVTNNSSKSLKYLVGPNVKSYKELEIHGKGGQHSELHENEKVNEALIAFLWTKDPEK